jgi:nicotinamide-nucleotide amidase
VTWPRSVLPMAVRAGIVVTGTEVLTGRVSDRNGPWLAEQLRQLGVDVGQIVVVGDRPDDMRSALAHLAHSHDLVITSGGLGPTADDLTAEVVGQFQGRPLVLDQQLEKRIGAIVDRLVARFGGTLDPAATAAGTRKQAMVPAGASVLEPTGTAPGLVVPAADGRTGPPVIVLPGPPRELQQMWPVAVAQPVVHAILVAAPELRQRTLRMWGVPESELAAMLRRAGDAFDGLEITTCLRDGELEIVSRYRVQAEPAQQRLADGIRQSFGDRLFSDGPTIDELVVAALVANGWTLAAAEAGLGGRTTARLTSYQAPGPVLGGLVVARRDPADDATAPALARNVMALFGADAGLGISGPGQDGEPVQIAVITPGGEHARSVSVSGPAQFVRERVSALAMHQLRETLTAAH